MFIREIYLNNLEPFINKPVVKIISGMRRSGKSTLMKMLIDKLEKSDVNKSDIIYISKELMEFDFVKDYKTLYSYIKKTFPKNKNAKYLVIDEVQEITGWEKAINSLLAEGAVDIFLTGSNSRMMSDELATLLTGRYIVIPMHPLSFKEFLQFRKVTNEEQYEKEFGLYLKYGGLPGIHFLKLEDEIVFQYIESIFNTILLKDIVQRYQVRDVSLLERITKFIFDNSGSITTAKKISDYLKSQNISAGVQTVQNYIFYIKEAFLINKAERYDIKGKRHLELYDKYYFNDSGIRHSLLKYRQDDISKLLENTVYLELIRRGYTVTFGKLDNLEVDFIAEKNSEKVYIQVCYLLGSKETEDREFGSLEKIPDNYKKMVLSMDKFWGRDRNGIIRMNIIDYLIGE